MDKLKLMWKYFWLIPAFLGKKLFIIWIVGLVASVFLGVVEVLIGLFIQLFLKSLGLLLEEVKVTSFIDNMHFTSASVMLILITLAFARCLGQFVFSTSSYKLSTLTTYRVRLLTLADMLIKKDGRFIPSSHINTQLSEIFPRAASFSYEAIMCVGACLQALVIFASMLSVAFKESLVMLLGFGVLGLLVIFVNKKLRTIAYGLPKEQKALVEGIERVARNWMLIKVIRANHLEFKRLSNNAWRYADRYIRMAVLHSLTVSSTPFIGVILIVAVILLNRSYWGGSSLVILSFLYLVLRLVQTLNTASTYLSSLNQMWPHFRTTIDYFYSFTKQEAQEAFSLAEKYSKEDGNIAKKLENIEDNRQPFKEKLPPGIVVNSVRFAYPGGLTPVLQDFSFSITPGQQIGIFGSSGCGKSTLLGLILGVLHPQDGEIHVDEVSPDTFFKDKANRAGYVGPEPFLIQGSIKDNLCYGFETNFEDDICWDALRLAHLEEVVKNLPGGLNYRLEENGDGLSAGQKQRLSLARALIAKPSLLVLDEASANLDTETERILAKNLYEELKGKVTMIVVSHRMEFLKFSDKIINLAEIAT